MDSLGDIQWAFPENPDRDEGSSTSCKDEEPMKHANYNTFDLISLSQGFDLSGLFGKVGESQESRFTTQKPASDIVSRLEQIAENEKFKVKKEDGMVKMKGSKEGRKGSWRSMLRYLK